MHHPPGKSSRAIIAATVALAAAGTVPAAAAAAHASPAEYVYVNDNTAGTNSVAGFVRRDDGGLAPVPGSPFNTGGEGTGSGLASQGAIQVSGDGRFVVTVDAGSNQISVLRIKRHGALELVPHGVVFSRGVQPVSIAEHEGLVWRSE
jgi:6-phosphogluconolactonase